MNNSNINGMKIKVIRLTVRHSLHTKSFTCLQEQGWVIFFYPLICPHHHVHKDYDVYPRFRERDCIGKFFFTLNTLHVFMDRTIGVTRELVESDFFGTHNC